jgi:hypothetical protein
VFAAKLSVNDRIGTEGQQFSRFPFDFLDVA